jgi:hypothetical protein
MVAAWLVREIYIVLERSYGNHYGGSPLLLKPTKTYLSFSFTGPN